MLLGGCWVTGHANGACLALLPGGEAAVNFACVGSLFCTILVHFLDKNAGKR